LNGGGAVGHNFERDPPRDHTCQVWFNLVQRFQSRKFKNVIFYQNMPNLHNRYKSAERKISQNKTEYKLNCSLPCSCSQNLSSFWLILKQQWTIEDISIFSNSIHLEWRAELSDTISQGTHPRTIPARYGLIRFRSFRGEDLNVKVYDVRRTDGRTPTDDRHQVMAKAHLAFDQVS
jgi:hypothetical protein